ncbi:uncharacterized protein LOC130220421 [Danio aesculapii]|uniref:uncharacterized protein LOC130220421 n=1 Tax=Danio aesculapii TaxID=1142201 RepID=UPI0024C0953F|nr:uncharacterized protein LOC130220421 [Danio aesculapii]
MFAQGLLLCVLLRAFSAQAKVVTSFNECSGFFYDNKEPTGMNQNAKKICQKVDYGGSYYATLYFVPHRIPLYSAYTLNRDCRTSGGRTNVWHIEPQISQPGSHTDHMVPESPLNMNTYKENQAISKDYSDTGYDRGHLNPNSFQCDEGRTATFTLTNAAPMDACFNRIHWKSWESTLRSFLLNKLISDGSSAKAYIVTGTVPSANIRIPQREVSEEPERVTVPSHIWTAVCYKHETDDRKSFSFGYLGKNLPAGGISLMSVSNLNLRLSELYGELSDTCQSINIFADDCFGDSNKLYMVKGVFQKLINQAENQVVEMSSSMQIMYNALKRTVSDDSTYSKRVKVKEMTIRLAFDSLISYLTVTEELKTLSGSVCLITAVSRLNPFMRRLIQRDVGSDTVECLLVSEKQDTAADGSFCISRYESEGYCSCHTGIKP